MANRADNDGVCHLGEIITQQRALHRLTIRANVVEHIQGYFPGAVAIRKFLSTSSYRSQCDYLCTRIQCICVRFALRQ